MKICRIWTKKTNFLQEQFFSHDSSDDESNKLKLNLAHFQTEIIQRWAKAYKKEAIFLKNNHLWLEGTYVATQNGPARR